MKHQLHQQWWHFNSCKAKDICFVETSPFCPSVLLFADFFQIKWRDGAHITCTAVSRSCWSGQFTYFRLLQRQLKHYSESLSTGTYTTTFLHVGVLTPCFLQQHRQNDQILSIKNVQNITDSGVTISYTDKTVGAVKQHATQYIHICICNFLLF